MPSFTFKHFILGLIFIFTLPIVFKADLLLFGEHTKGEVLGHRAYQNGNVKQNGGFSQTVVKFYAGSEMIHYKVPSDLNFNKYREVDVFYRVDNPDRCMIFHPYSFIFGMSSVFPFFLLFIWCAAYLTYRT